MSHAAKVLIALAVGLLLVLGWLLGIPYLSEQRAIRAVNRYTIALVEALDTLDASTLEQAASADQQARVEQYLGTFMLEGTKLKAKVLSIEVDSVAPGPSGVVVRVQEVWQYAKVDQGTGSAVEPPYRETSTLVYTLDSRGRQLIVDDVEIEETQREVVEE